MANHGMIRSIDSMTCQDNPVKIIHGGNTTKIGNVYNIN